MVLSSQAKDSTFMLGGMTMHLNQQAGASGKAKLWYDIITTVVICVIYLVIARALRGIPSKQETIQILGFELANTVFKGVVAQIQLVLTVIIVLKDRTFTYVVAVLLSLYSIIITVVFSLIAGNQAALPGTISYTGMLFIIYLFFQYNHRAKLAKIELEATKQMLRSSELELEKIAYYDGLTHVLNRKKFIEELSLLVRAREETNDIFYVAFLDIDNFKAINDEKGHFVGDYVLVTMTNRIQALLGPSDYIGRLGGDEIGLLILSKRTIPEIRAFMEAIRREIMKDFIYENETIYVTASMGVAKYPGAATTPSELLKVADLAMYESKKEGKNRFVIVHQREEMGEN